MILKENIFFSKNVHSYRVCSFKETTSKSRHEIWNNVVCATSKDSDQPAHMPEVIAFASRLNILWVLGY